MKILIMGAGALGSVFGGFLSKNNEVTLIGREPHISKVNEDGLRISGIWGEHIFKDLKAFDRVEKEIGTQDLILITTKSYDTEEAVEEITPLLKGDTSVMSMQNGIGNEEAIAKIVGEDRTLGGMAIFGALLIEPGHVKVTVYASECLVGPIKGDIAEATKIAENFSAAGIPTLPSENIMREKWMKAFYNIALNPLSAILKVPYGELGQHRETREIMKGLLEEAFQVAKAEEIDPNLTPDEYFRYLLKKQLPPTAQHRSSMLQDIEKGKKTEIDYLNGAIVELGRKHGIETPRNEIVVDLVKVLEKSNASPSP
ncbi:MAG: ketopantoate reductase family protein [Candidatus Hydrothermarchaeales archaeon]